MPLLNLSLTGETNSSVSGMVTDPTTLQQIKAIMRHMSDRSQVDPVTQAPEGSQPGGEERLA